MKVSFPGIGGAYAWLLQMRRSYRLMQMRRKHNGNSSIVYKLPCGYQMELQWHDHIAQRLLLSDTFEPEVSAVMFALVRPSMTVVDIGANIGVHTLHLSKLVGRHGRVLAFEPNHSARRQLEANLVRNGLRNVTVLDSALWERDGSETFYFPAIGLEALGGLKANTRFKVARQARVPTARLDTVLGQLGVQEIDFIKIDVEGAELQVVRGAGSLIESDRRPALLYESTLENSLPYAYTPDDIRAFLLCKEYTVEMIDHANYLALPSSAA